jgi:hypothetical protein
MKNNINGYHNGLVVVLMFAVSWHSGVRESAVYASPSERRSLSAPGQGLTLCLRPHSDRQTRTTTMNPAMTGNIVPYHQSSHGQQSGPASPRNVIGRQPSAPTSNYRDRNWLLKFFDQCAYLITTQPLYTYR